MPRRHPEELTRKQMIDTSTGPAQRPQLKQVGRYLHSLTKVIDSKTYVSGLREPITGVTLRTQTQEELDALSSSLAKHPVRASVASEIPSVLRPQGGAFKGEL